MHETMPTCFGYRTRPIPSDRHIPSARRGIYPVRSARSNLSRKFFSSRMKCRITCGPRYPDHEQPSRKWGRTAAGPATGTSVAPGPPVTHVTPLPHPIDPDVRTAFMKAGGGYRPEARHPPTRPGPHAPANLRGGRVRARGPGSAQGETRGPRMCPPRASRCPCTFSGWLFMVWR